MSAIGPEILLPEGPPYVPQVAMLGLIPTIRIDVPICIILIIFFLAGAGLSLFIFLRNNSCGHKFLFSTVLVGFCTTRIIALSLRIAWATQPWNIKLEIAATVFAAAGVVLLFFIALIFTHRLLRALHPNLGWMPAVGYFFLFLYFFILVCLICAVTATVVSFYTLDFDRLYKCRLVQLFSSTSLAILAFLPVLIVLGAVFYPGLRRPEPFGYGSISTKVLIVLITSLLLTVGAAYRCAVNYAVRPVWAPAWWHHKACYYIFNYDLELVVIFTYILMRFDMRFHVPDGACKAGDYAKGQFAYQRVSAFAVGRHRHRHHHHRHHRRSRRHCDDRSVEIEVEEAFVSRGSRSGVIRGLSEIGDARTYLEESYGDTSYNSSSYHSASRHSNSHLVTTSISEEIVEREEEKSRGRRTTHSRKRDDHHHRHHHHHHHHGRRKSRDRKRSHRRREK